MEGRPTGCPSQRLSCQSCSSSFARNVLNCREGNDKCRPAVFLLSRTEVFSVVFEISTHCSGFPTLKLDFRHCVSFNFRP
jgi:hypothetical protein